MMETFAVYSVLFLLVLIVGSASSFRARKKDRAAYQHIEHSIDEAVECAERVHVKKFGEPSGKLDVHRSFGKLHKG